MILTIANKEFRAILRDGRALYGTIVFALLGMLALVTGAIRYSELDAERLHRHPRAQRPGGIVLVADDKDRDAHGAARLSTRAIPEFGVVLARVRGRKPGRHRRLHR